METIICQRGKYQALRKELLKVAGETVIVKHGEKSLTWKFDEKEYEDYNPKTISKDEFIKNMIEKEIHEIYQILMYGGILARKNGEEIITAYEGNSIKEI